MTRCETCDESMGLCSCDNLNEECVYRLTELDHFVWNFSDLITLSTVDEVEMEGRRVSKMVEMESKRAFVFCVSGFTFAPPFSF